MRKILGCGSLAVVTLKFTIGKIEKEGRKTYLCEDPVARSNKGFYVPVPSSVAQQLKAGDTVAVTCTPNDTISWATSALVVKVFTSDTSCRDIYNTGVYTGHTNLDIFQ